MGSIDSLSSELPLVTCNYQLQDLITLAQNNRADLKAAIGNRELSVTNQRHFYVMGLIVFALTCCD